MKEKERIEIRKRNMRLFLITKTLGWDYIFFYTTNFLFLTQVKHISAADVVLIDSFYALFGILMQVPATFIIEYIGRKKSIVLGNFLNCIYMILVMTSRNLFNLIVSGIITKKQQKFHEKHKNKTLSILLFFIGISILGAGISGVISEKYNFAIIFIIVFYLIGNCYKSIFYPLIERYLRSFANEEIDTKIFVARNFLGSVISAVIGLFASFLLDRMSTAYCMIAIGGLALVITIMMSKYMKSRVGLNPNEYSKEETKYDELKI